MKGIIMRVQRDKITQPLTKKEQALFEAIALAAAENLPCPTAKELQAQGLVSNLIRQLTQKGFVQTTLYVTNERMVTILCGPHVNKSTRKPDGNPRIKKIIEQDLDRDRKRREPSSLRLPEGW